ncbi:MAG: Ig-like domain-containing protein, partial [Opitutaceae bacterium]
MSGPAAMAAPPQNVTVTAPTNGANLQVSSPNPTINVTASAIPSTSGNIASVEFRVNGTSIGSTTTAPYSVGWSPTGAGTYSITATATDSSSATGNTLTSTPVSVTVSSLRAASVVAPANNSAVPQNSQIFFRATAAMSDGVVGQVEFLLDGVLLGSPVTSAPYSLATTVSAPVGSHAIVARARASDGTTTFESSPVTINVVAPIGNGPVVTITTSATGPVAVGSNVTVSASANDVDGFIPTTAPGGVTFYADGEVIGTDLTAPYSVTWSPTVAKVVSLRAQAIDDKGNSRFSDPLSVTVVQATTPGSVALTSPPAGSAVTVGVPTTLTATATPSPGTTITQVQFLLGSTILGAATSPPYSFSWTPSAAGPFSLAARVIDSGGNSLTSAMVPVTAITAPTSGITLALTPSNPSIPAGTSRLVVVTVPATVAADRVELYYDGQLVGTDTLAPFSFVFTAPGEFGPHFLSATAISATGVQTTSPAFPIAISGPAGSPPLISILAPNSGAFIGIATGTPLAPSTPITGTVSDADGSVSSVQVIVNGNSIGSATLTGSTWSIAWTPTVSGVASITAIATDNNGNAVAAPAVGVTVTDASSPAITLTATPRVSATVPGSTTLPSRAVRNFHAEVTPSLGRAVVRVEFFVDGTKVGEDTTAPYSYRYLAPELSPEEQSHTFVLSARATDNAGAARDVLVPLLVVSPVGLPPAVSLLTPADGASVAPNVPVNLAATAVANGGTITSVQFYANGSPVGINNGVALTAAPYAATFTPTAAGTYIIDAIGTDDRGNTTVSNAATITVAFSTPTIVFTSPNPNATARATPNVPVTLTASATIQTGTGASILLVEFLLDGMQIGADTVAPYTISWIPTTAHLGQHVLTARVTDTNSQTATSAPLSINVANVIGSPPTVSVSATPVPLIFGLQTASTVNFVANAVATGGSTLRSVEIFLNDISIGTGTREQTTNLYRVAYDLNRFDFTTVTPVINEITGVLTYPVRLYAIARDSNDNQTVSPTINLVLNPATSSPPSVQLQALSPTNVTAGTQVFFAPNINDPDGAVTSLQLFANGTAVGTFANPQQGQPVFYTASQAGRFNIYAVATDDTGNTAVSSPSIVINVTAVSAPVTTLTRPSDNTTATTVDAPVFLEGTAVNNATTQVPTLQFVATAAGGARTVINGARVGNTTTYRATWIPVNADTYNVSTQASVGTVQGTSPQSRRVAVTNVVGLAPTVTITGGVPTTATTASLSNFTATAADPDGSVVGVEFYLNRNKVGDAVRDPQGNTWRITASFAGLQPGATEVVALARDSSGNVVDSTTNSINVTAATSIAPSVTIEPSATNAPFNRQVQLRANARDSDSATGNVTSVQYFANATSLGTSTNAGQRYQVNWTPNQSGTFFIWAVATDNTGITTVAPTVQIVVRRNNPVLEHAAFILQTYQDIANTTTINPPLFDDLDTRLADGSLTRADLVASLVSEPGFVAPVNLLAVHQVLMGQLPSAANYATFLATARTSLPNAVGQIISSPDFLFKYGLASTPNVALLNNPNGALPAQALLDILWTNAGAAPSTTRALDLLRFMSNNIASPTVGRGYGPAGLNAAIAEFVTNTNSGNTALFARARAAAVFYQLTRPAIGVTVDEITQRVDAIARLPDVKAMADAALKDILYGYRYVTITRHPASLAVSPNSGAIFSVEAQGAPPLAYQWLLNGAPVPGGNSPTLSVTNVDATRVGSYTVAITSSAATATSDPATLSLSAIRTRLANISTRGVTTGGDNVLIGGFVVSGTQGQNRQMLIRVVGPTLGNAPFNVTGVLANPRLEVYSGATPTPVLTNDDWGSQAGGAAQVTAIQQAMNRAAAFAFSGPNSADAAVLATLPPGPYTVQAKGPANNPNASGVVLIEVYDVTQGGPAGPRASNVSTRGSVGTGANILIAGFVINGEASRRVLIRGAGPTLAALRVPGVLADPELTLIEQSSGRTIKTNDDWATGDDAAIIAQAATAAGAFPFANGSKDAAMIVMLPPGAYT